MKYYFLKKYMGIAALGFILLGCEPVDLESVDDNQTNTHSSNATQTSSATQVQTDSQSSTETDSATLTQTDLVTDTITDTASQSDSQTDTQTDSTQLVGDAVLGASLFKDLNCALCHGDGFLGSSPLGAYSALDKNKTQFSHSSTPTDIQNFVQYTSDWMPSPGSCDLQCASDIKAYVDTWPEPVTTPPTDGDTQTQTATQTQTTTQTQTSVSTDTQTQTGQMTDTQTQVELNDLEKAGQTQYNEQCASCHSDKGDGARANTSSILLAIEEETAVKSTQNRMPLLTPALCDLGCANEVIAYIAKINGLAFEVEAPNVDPTAQYDLQYSKTTQTYRQASILLGKGIPTDQELNSIKDASSEELRQALLDLMSGDGFKSFIKNSANDRLLVRSLGIGDVRFQYENWYQEFSTQFADKDDYNALGLELKEQPLELINYVIQNDRPYTEILTADYVLASKQLATLYQWNIIPEEGQWIEAKNNGQYIMSEANNNQKRPSKNWSVAVKTQIPEAGILSSQGFLFQNPSTATNRNRARSRWTMFHFLGYDIEATAPRVKLEDADDADNPTLNNSACTVCHNIMDPIAAGFQDFGFNGLHMDGKQGKHALSFDYVNSDLYEDTQTWYADVLPAGFDYQDKPANEVAIQWLAKKITEDDRFATAAIKFWWPAIFGREFYETDSQAELDKQLEFATLTAQDFKNNDWDFKLLLADLLMSDWYLLNNIASTNEKNDQAPLTFNGQRILTPEELHLKQKQLFGIDGEYLNKHYLSYGGIDSTETTVRDRNMNVVKLNVLKANAFKDFCSVAYQDFSKPKNKRVLFKHVELNTLSGMPISTQSNSTTSDLKFTRYKPTLTNDGDVTIKIEMGKGDVLLRKMKIRDPNGLVIFNAKVSGLENSTALKIDTNAEKIGDDYRFKNSSKYLTITLEKASIVNGEYFIDTYHLPQVDGEDAALFVTISSTAAAKDVDDKNALLIKQQIQGLYELLTGEVYAVDHEEILLTYQLFHKLRDNAEQRGSTGLIGDGYLCLGESTKNGFDKYYTFAAWKGLLITLATDYGFAI